MEILEQIKKSVTTEELARVMAEWIETEGQETGETLYLSSWDEAAFVGQSLADVYKAASERWDEILDLEKDDQQDVYPESVVREAAAPYLPTDDEVVVVSPLGNEYQGAVQTTWGNGVLERFILEDWDCGGLGPDGGQVHINVRKLVDNLVPEEQDRLMNYLVEQVKGRL